MVIVIKGNGIQFLNMVMDYKYLILELHMKVNGSLIWLMVMENLTITMVIHLKAFGFLEKLMDMAPIQIKMDLTTKASGRTISNMVKEKKYGLMVHPTKENTVKVKNMEVVNTYGMIIPLTMENGLKMIFKVKVRMCQIWDEHTKDSGKITKCMAMVFMIGEMAELIQVFILLIRNLDLVCLIGMMVENMKVNGSMINSMVKESIIFRMGHFKLDIGNREYENIGLAKKKIMYQILLINEIMIFIFIHKYF